MQATSPKLYDWEVFEQVAPYLNIGDLLKTATLSKEYNYTLKSYFRKHFLTKESLQGGQNELHVMKKLFHRQIKIYKLSDSKSFTMTPNVILQDIQLGNEHTLIETYQGQKHLVQISDVATTNKIEITNNNRYQGDFMTLIGDCLFTVKNEEITKMIVKQTEQGLTKVAGNIGFDGEIIAVKQSQTHIFVVTTNILNQNKLFAIHIKDFKEVEVLYEQQNDKQTKHIEIDNLSVGANIAYYIKDLKVYQLDVHVTKEPKIMNSLKDKQITKIINGAKHFFAIEKGHKLTSEWDTKDLIEWSLKQGYEDYVKIFKSQKVTGETLLKMDKKYMEDVLGIINVKVQQRLMVQLQEWNVENDENCTVYGWGRNDNSQLGINPSNPVSIPHKIVLPEGFKFLRCYNNQTFIHNKKTGQIRMNIALEGKLSWQSIFNNVHSIWSMSISRDYVMILCSFQKSYISQNMSQQPVHQKKQKLRTAKNIIDKIQWDDHLNKQEFRVGYLDKFTGVLEISFNQLLESTEIKDYRIEYFKQKGEVVWSKKDRVDIL